MKRIIDVCYSTDDGGYYAMLCNEEFKDIHTTEVFPSSIRASDAAKLWAENETGDHGIEFRIIGIH